MAVKKKTSRFEPRGPQAGEKTADGKTVVSGAGGPPKQTFTIPSSEGSQSVNKDEYETYKATQGFENSKGGQMTPAVQEAVAAEQERATLLNLQRQAMQRQSQEQIILNAAKKRGFVLPEQQIQQPMPKPFETDLGRERISAGLRAEEGTIRDKVLPDSVQRFNLALEETRKAVMRPQTVVTLVDAIRKGITGGKPLQVEQASQTFNELETGLRESIQSLSNGTGDAATVNQQLQEASDAMRRLEEFQHAKGLEKLYLRYWADEGADLEAKILIMKTTINQLLIEAQAAEQQGNIARAQALLGQ